MSDIPTFEDWKANQAPELLLGSLEIFLLIYHTVVADEWRERLQREYRSAFGLVAIPADTQGELRNG